jgi:UDP-glucose 4-epimerase
MFGVDYIIFRPHNVYGERQNIADRYRNVVGIFMNQLLRGEPLTVFGDGSQERAFTHIDDVAPVIAGSVNYPAARNQVFNVGADEPYTVNDLAQIIADAMGAPCDLIHLDPRNEVKIAFADHSKAQRIFGQPDKKSLRDGVAAMAAWVKDHGSRESGVFEGIEILKNLPASWAKVTPAQSARKMGNGFA